MAEERLEQEGDGPGAPGPSREDEAAAGRHVTNAILANIVAELREMGGDELVERVRQRAGERRTVEEMTYLLGWSTLDQAVAMLEAAVALTGDPEVPFRAGQWSFRVVASAEFVDGLRALGGPGELLRLIGPVAARVTTVTDAEAVEVAERHAVVHYRTRAPHVRDPLMCRYTAGTLASFPTVFGLAAGEVTELACQTAGDTHCVYRVGWDPGSSDEVDAETRIAALEERVETLSARFENLQTVSAMLSGTHDIDAVLQAVVRLAGVAVSAPHHVLAVRLPGERAPRVHAVGMPAGQAETLAAELLAAEPGTARLESWSGPYLAVEVASPRRRYGRLAAFAAGEFLPHDDRLLAAYAGHATAALEAAVAFEETRLLLAFSAQLAEIAATDEMTTRIAQAALRVVASDRAAVLLWEPADGLLVRSAVAGWPVDTAAVEAHGGVGVAGCNGRPPAVSVDGEALLSWALASNNRPCAAWEDPLLRPVQRAAGCSRGIAVPLVARRQLLGMLVLDAGSEVQGVDEDVARRVAGVANLAASALHSARLLEMVQHQANHDILTGLPNARLFGDRLTVAMAACRRTGSGLAILFVDLDRFKDVNDRLGHAAGDRILCEVAERLRQTVREVDSVARLGGDEFVILVPDLTGPDGAEAARNRIAAALAAAPVQVLGEEVPLQASIGLARFPEDGTSPGDLLHRADIAMYRTKLSRRAARP